MTRVFGRKQDYVPVTKLSDTRYCINFDFVTYESNEDCGWWSVVNYFEKPTTEQVQSDVVKYTIQRYEQEGLTPPADIDVSQYIIDDGKQ